MSTMRNPQVQVMFKLTISCFMMQGRYKCNRNWGYWNKVLLKILFYLWNTNIKVYKN